MLLLRNPIQPYDWGEVDGLARLVGCERTGDHQAELWVGTHDRGPSVVASGPDEGRSLADVVAERPERMLGRERAAQGRTGLPFLLKILAIAKPLSLQAHPSTEQAEAGFDREEAAGIAIDARERNYRDRSAKPEAIVALVDTWVLCGFREPSAAADLIAALDVEALAPLVDALRAGGPAGLRQAVEWLLCLQGRERDDFGRAVALAVADKEGPDGLAEDRSDPMWWVARLAGGHRGDPACVAPLLLQLVKLAPGDAVYLPAGNLHGYLQGAGIEIMGASDNVLRGGLTSKHVDAQELLGVLRFDTGVPRPRRVELTDAITTYDAGEDSFALVRVDPTDDPVTIDPSGPSLLLAVDGAVDVAGPDHGVSIDHGDAAFVAPGEGPLTVTGPGQLWWATVGDALAR